MSDDAVEWVAVASFPAMYLAEVAIHQLEDAGIPVLAKGVEAGIWGPAFAGPTSAGISLVVPEERAAEARELLGGLAADEPGDDAGEG